MAATRFTYDEMVERTIKQIVFDYTSEWGTRRYQGNDGQELFERELFAYKKIFGNNFTAILDEVECRLAGQGIEFRAFVA